MAKKIGTILVSTALLASIVIPSVLACAWTPGYWKNHREAWPTTSLTIGGVTYSESQLMGILWASNKGNAWINLMQKVIAMRFSILVVPGPAADALLAEADAWFVSNPTGPVLPKTVEGQAGLDIAGQLDDLLNLWDVE